MNAEKSSQIVIQQVTKPGRRLIWNSLVIQHVIHPKHTTNAIETNLDERTMKHFQARISLARARTSTLSKQCGVISAESGINCSQHPKSILREACRIIPEDRLI